MVGIQKVSIDTKSVLGIQKVSKDQEDIMTLERIYMQKPHALKCIMHFFNNPTAWTPVTARILPENLRSIRLAITEYWPKMYFPETS